ncbi:CD63 antigen-like [Cimex lectularius]|uniref:Tetraspanin n=1 Tax=Cimex lectularius TaxID=79782 RepID=A0A8I6SBQ5_CIMLE|nr:CD63 antigen-like [Cimex lectularius]
MCGYRKLYLLLATIVTAAIGFGMIIFGKMKMNEVVFLDAFLSDHIHVGRTFIGLGVLLFIIAFVGMAGVTMHISLFLLIYACLMLTLVVTQIVVGVTIFTRMATIRNSLSRTLEEKFRTYDQHKAEIDKLQSVILCCGMSGPKVWKIKDLPPSCCGMEKGSCSVKSAYSSSCSEKAGNIVEGGLYFVSIICFILIFIELKCVALACCLSDFSALLSLCAGLGGGPKEKPQTASSSEHTTSREILLRE